MTEPTVRVRSPRDWYSDDAHVQAAPDHYVQCANCHMRFDIHIDRATGEHYPGNHRPATFCSARCQRQAKYGRSKGADFGPTVLHGQGDIAVYTEAHSVLSKVRHDLAVGVYWAPLYRREWAVMELEAPDVAVLLRYFEDVNAARDKARAGVSRFGTSRAEKLRRAVVERIDQWFRDNQPEEAQAS